MFWVDYGLGVWISCLFIVIGFALKIFIFDCSSYNQYFFIRQWYNKFRNFFFKMDLTIYFLYKLWLGVDSTLGAGAYILVGTVAREHSGRALTLSFPYSWNSFCFFSLLLCWACKSLAICWECLSLFIHMCWRRVSPCYL